MHLEGRVPEMLRVAVLAGEEPDVRRLGIGRKGERERDLDGRAVGALALALEIVGVEVADAGGAERFGIRRAPAFQHQHREPLLVGEEIAIERAEGEDALPMRRDVGRVRHAEQFDEHARKLDDVILRPPGAMMAVARADLEAEPTIELLGRVEIAHGVDDVVETARHGTACFPYVSLPPPTNAAI